MPPNPPTFSQHQDTLLVDQMGASRAPPPPPDALKEVEGLVARLHAEAAGASDRTRKARLLCEIAELEERAGDEPAAARDYLASFNAEATFREPLEGLVRLLERRRSLRNLGKLVDALVRAAVTPEEQARALTLRAFFLEDVGGDLEGAKGAAEDATLADAPAGEAATAWLTLELLSAKSGDAATRARALDERTRYTTEPTWRALLLIDAARVTAAEGDMDGALASLDRAREESGGATYATAIATARLSRAYPGNPGTEQATERTRRYAAALEAQAGLIQDAMASPERGEQLGVPRWTSNPMQMVDAWLRAAEARRTVGELGPAAQLLDRALAALPGVDGGDAFEPALLDARIRIADRSGETALAAELAAKRLEGEEDGGVAAAMAMRVAEHAAREGDTARALEALATAVARDPASLPARAMQLDLLADTHDAPDGHGAARFATELETFAACLPTDEGRGRAGLLAAYVWAVRARNTERAKASLAEANALGVPTATVARLGRTLASITGDADWHEAATRRLLAEGAAGADEDELPSLWLEVARARFAKSDAGGGHAALRELGATAKGAWLGRALEAFLPPSRDANDDDDALEAVDGASGAARRRVALDELAARSQTRDVARGLTLMAAMRAHAAGDIEGAGARLRELSLAEPGDPLVATYLGDLERAAGEHGEAASTAASAAAATDDEELRAALHLEAGLERWRQGDAIGSLRAFEEALSVAPEAARVALSWTARAIDPDSPEGRRAAVRRAREAGVDARALHLETFATDLAADDADGASDALAALEDGADGAMAIAAAIARVAWPQGDDDPQAVRAALERLATSGPEGAAIAAGEHMRMARGGNAGDTVDAARAWFQAGGGLTAGVEWVAATVALGEPDEELAARRGLAIAMSGEAREAILASAALLQSVHAPDEPAPLILGTSDAARLANLELAPPGSDPRRRIFALTTLGGALGEDAELDAHSLAGWSWLVDGNAAEALDAFDRVTTIRADDLAAWEGMRAASDALGDTPGRAVACEQIGSLCSDDARGADFWEQAAHTWLELGEEERAEAAFDASFARDATRAVAFDKLFRRVRDRKDGERLLALVGRRLEVTDDPPEIAKLFWEQARVLREKGDQDGAIKALENVTMLEPDHVGALALTGEISIRRGNFAEAAAALARLALLPEAPARSRVTAGIAAVDLYENKLNQLDRALEILLALHRAQLSSLPVRERLARAAARTGSWKEATDILQELMHQRTEQEGRIEAARLAMAIFRDRLSDPNGARGAVVKLLEESPTDGEAIDMLLTTDQDPAVRQRLLERARASLIESLQRRPFDLPAVRRLAKVARALGDDALQQAALSISLVLGGHDAMSEQLFAQLVARKPRTPQIAITEAILGKAIDPGDAGPLAELFKALGPTLAEAFGPSLVACGVTKRDRVDPRSGIALRNEIAAWAGAFGIREFDLYIGGKDPLGVQGVPGEMPSLVVGAGVNAPLAPATRARVVRELVAMVRGTTVVRSRDDTTVAAIVVAACSLGEVHVDAPAYAVQAEVDRLLGKAIARKTRKMLPELCRAIVDSGVDARAWARRALSSQSRVAVIACGDVGVVLSDVLGEPFERLAGAVKVDARAEELIRFTASPTYVELRRSLGLEGGT
jgi:hypothetical protein